MINMNYILTYLHNLSENNNRDWFHEHKQEKDEAMKEFEQLLQYLIDELSIYDETLIGLHPKDLVFRLNRDTRFSKNLPPYKTSFSAHISSGGRLPIPVGYFISIQPNNSFIGGGLFASQFPQATDLIRQHILQQPFEFESILTNKDFTSNFTLIGEKLKNVPKELDKEHRLAEYLKHKSWAIEHFYSDTQLKETNIAEDFIEKFLLMKKFNDFLNEALNDFQMPERRSL